MKSDETDGNSENSSGKPVETGQAQKVGMKVAPSNRVAHETVCTFDEVSFDGQTRKGRRHRGLFHRGSGGRGR